MAVTRDELIAKVYELCGAKIFECHIEMEKVRRWPEHIGLDEFISDIVPVLNERGWDVSVATQNGGGLWFAEAWASKGPWSPVKSKTSPDPVEAAFAVALEVLGE